MGRWKLFCVPVETVSQIFAELRLRGNDIAKSRLQTLQQILEDLFAIPSVDAEVQVVLLDHTVRVWHTGRLLVGVPQIEPTLRIDRDLTAQPLKDLSDL